MTTGPMQFGADNHSGSDSTTLRSSNIISTGATTYPTLAVVAQGEQRNAAISTTAFGTPSVGVMGTTDGQNDCLGVAGKAKRGKNSVGVYGEAPNVYYPPYYVGYAGFFNGNVQVKGILNKSGGGFKIDRPGDERNRYLCHSFVESPDMKNVYDGIARLDEDGSAWIELPEWFGELNGEYRYQLTATGEPAPNLHVAEEISANRFRIAGGTAGMKVSWQVTGIRKDPWAEMNRIVVEEEKPPDERGKYLHPEAFGRPEERETLPGIEERGGPDERKTLFSRIPPPREGEVEEEPEYSEPPKYH